MATESFSFLLFIFSQLYLRSSEAKLVFFFFCSQTITRCWRWSWKTEISIVGVVRFPWRALEQRRMLAAHFCLGVSRCQAALWSAPPSHCPAACALLSSVFTVHGLQQTRKGPWLAWTKGACVGQLWFPPPPFLILTTASSSAQRSPALAAGDQRPSNQSVGTNYAGTDGWTASEATGRWKANVGKCKTSKCCVFRLFGLFFHRNVYPNLAGTTTRVPHWQTLKLDRDLAMRQYDLYQWCHWDIYMINVHIKSHYKMQVLLPVLKPHFTSPTNLFSATTHHIITSGREPLHRL